MAGAVPQGDLTVVIVDGNIATGTAGLFVLGRPTVSLPAPLPPLLDNEGRVFFFAYSDDQMVGWRRGIWTGEGGAATDLVVDGQVLWSDPGCTPGTVTCEVFNVRRTFHVAPGGEVLLQLSRDDDQGPFGGGSTRWLAGTRKEDLARLVSDNQSFDPFDYFLGVTREEGGAWTIGRFLGSAPWGEPGGLADFTVPLVGAAAPGLGGPTIDEVLPGAVDPVYGTSFSSSDAGEMILVASLSDGGEALYRTSEDAGAPLTLLARTADTVPGIPAAEFTALSYFTSAGTAAVSRTNGAGFTVFRADWKDQAGPEDAVSLPRRGVWRSVGGGPPELVATEWIQIAGDPEFVTSEGPRTVFRKVGSSSNQFTLLEMAPNGDVYFVATAEQLDGGGSLIVDSERRGLWRAPAAGGPLELVLRQSNASLGVPGTLMPDGSRFASFGASGYGFDEAGRMVVHAQVYVASFFWESIFGSLRPSGAAGFPSFATLGFEDEVIWVAPEDERVVAELEFNSTPFVDGTLASFRRGCLAFGARFQDDSRAVLRSCLFDGYVVNSTADRADLNPGDDACDTGVMAISGAPECTLRAALQEANATSGVQEIRFELPEEQLQGQGWVIDVPTALPPITDPVVLDGTTQEGYSPLRPVIDLVGPGTDSPMNGLIVTAGDTTIRGLSIHGFGYQGIAISGPGGNVVQANILGTNTWSRDDSGIGENGIQVYQSDGNLIGGSAGSGRNLVSKTGLSSTGGCGIAIVIASDNQVSGNFVGTDRDGAAVLGNAGAGICVKDASSNQVGGPGGEGNLVSGNREGILLQSIDTTDNEVLGNLVGTDLFGAGRLGNREQGILVDATGSGNRVGDGSENGSNVVVLSGEAGIEIRHGTGGNSVDGNQIGFDLIGTPNAWNVGGIVVRESPGNRIGAGGGNVVADNLADGIAILGLESLGTQVQGNVVGLDSTGAPRSNGRDGIRVVDAPSTRILGNIVAGNGIDGIAIRGFDSVGTEVQGNVVGLDQAGVPQPNGRDGVRVVGARSARIVGNVITGNWGDGVALLGSEGTDPAPPHQQAAAHVVSGNSIGQDLAGAAYGNDLSGVLLRDVGQSRIAWNTIRGNFHVGVEVLSGEGNVITRNRISDNIDMGIDLAGDGVTPNDNDDLDADPGANALQNYPEIELVEGAPLNRLSARLRSVPNRDFVIEVYSNPLADASGYGEGDRFESTLTVSTDASGEASFYAGFGAPVGACLALTARDAVDGHTSEFSQCVSVPPPSAAPVDFGDAPDSGGRYPTLLANDGARHRLGSGLYLGERVDPETDGQPTAGADGDDGDGVHDERGVRFLDPLAGGGTAYVEVTSSGAGRVDAWIDFQADGDWDDPGEQILVDVAVTSGANVLQFPVPVDATEGPSYARFRLSSAGGLAPAGPAADGEVEDMLVELVGDVVFADGFESGDTTAWQ